MTLCCYAMLGLAVYFVLRCIALGCSSLCAALVCFGLDRVGLYCFALLRFVLHSFALVWIASDFFGLLCILSCGFALLCVALE